MSKTAQRDRVLREAKHREMAVAAEFSDEGRSGKNTTGRPAFTEMMRCIQDGNIQKERISLTKSFGGQVSMENTVQMPRYTQEHPDSWPDATKKLIFMEIIKSVKIFEEPKPDGRTDGR